MSCPSTPADCCEGEQHSKWCMAIGQSARELTNESEHGAIAFARSPKYPELRKLPVVAVVVVNVNTVLSGKLLKGLLGGQCFDGGIIDLVVYETQSGVMVHKDGATSVPLLGGFPFQLGVNLTSVDTIWSTETISPGFVAVKTV